MQSVPLPTEQYPRLGQVRFRKKNCTVKYEALAQGCVRLRAGTVAHDCGEVIVAGNSGFHQGCPKVGLCHGDELLHVSGKYACRVSRMRRTVLLSKWRRSLVMPTRSDGGG